MYMKHLYKPFVSLFLRYKHSHNHRITGIKVSCLDINTVVDSSDQNRENLSESDFTLQIQVHLNKLECRGKVHLFQ